MDIFKLVGSIFVKNDEANTAIDDTTQKAKSMSEVLGKKMQDAGSTIEKVGKKLTPVSVAAGAMLTGSVKGASDFQDGMSKMSTLFDTTKTSVSDLSEQFLDLSNKSGLSATELAEAGYQALSAGQSVDNVAGFVETAGNLARAGFTSTTTAVDVLTTAMNAYGEEAGSAEDIANKLVRTQNLGKTTVDELAGSMGRIIPTASSMGVGIDNLTSGYVSLTKQGIATSEATTYMNSMLNELGDSGTILGGVLKEKTGKSFQELMDDGYSLADVLQITKDYADESGVAYNELWGSAEAGKAGLAILNGGVEEFNSTVETMGSNVDDVGQALEKLNTPSFQVQESINRVKNSGIELGTSLMTALAPTLEKVAGAIEKVTDWFNGLDDGTKNMIGTALAVVAALAPVLVIGGKLIGGIGSFIAFIPQIQSGLTLVSGGFKAFFGILAANPIVLVVGAIVGLIAIFAHLWNTSESFRNFWKGLWNSIKTTVTNVWTGIKTAVSNGINNVKNSISTGLNAAKNTVSNIFNSIKTKITNVMNSAKSTVSNAISNIKSKFNFSWSLPKLKLPHPKITGHFSLNPPSAPHFSLEWYKKAMDNPFLMTKPTVFDVNPVTGKAKAGGEAGDEMIYGRQNLLNDIREATDMTSLEDLIDDWMNRLFDLLLQYLPELANMQMVTDTGALVGELAPAMDRRLGVISAHKERGN